MTPEPVDLRSLSGFVPIRVTPRSEESPTLTGHQTFAKKEFDPFWGIDFFSSAGTLDTGHAISASASIERVLAEGRYRGNESMTSVARLLAVSLPRNRPIVNLALDTLPALRPGVALSLVIPVAATQEERAVPELLAALKKQNLDRSVWEALLFLNVASRRDGGRPDLDRSTERIQDFVHHNPDLNIRALGVHYSLPQPIGAIRHDAACTVLARHLARWPRGPDDHLLLMADADTANARPEWLTTMYKQSLREPKVVAIRGPSRWDRRGLASHPLPLLLATAGEAVSLYLKARFPEAGEELPTGPNLAVRASAFSKCGYSPSTTLGEDLELVRRLAEIGEVRSIGARATVKTSSRRLVVAAEHGVPPDRQWESTSPTAFGGDNPEIRARAGNPVVDREVFLALLDHGLPPTEMLAGMLLKRIISCLIVERINQKESLPKASHSITDEIVRDVLVEKLSLPVTFFSDPGRLIIKDAAKLKAVLVGWRDSIVATPDW